MSVATKLLQVLIKSSTSASAKAIEVPAGVGDLGGQVVIKAQGDAKYQLKDLTQNGLGPQMIKAKRLGQNLMITFEDGAVADLVIEDYYSQTSEPAQGLVGQVSDGGLQNYLVENHEAFRNLGQLMDGSRLVDAVLAHSPSMVPVAAPVGVSSLANASAAVGTLGLNPLAAVAGLVGTAATVGTVGAADKADKAETADKVGTPANGSIPDESLSVSPVNHPVTGSLSISGSAVQGATFQAVSTLADVDGMGPVIYQWYANGELIEGATGDTFTPGQAHIGKVFTVQASVTDALGHTEVVSSALTAAVANVNDALTGDVSISGTPEQYQTLTASHTLADIDGLGDVTYQWQANGQDIPGATGNTFTLAQAHVGQVLTVKASYTDAWGAAETLSSAPTAAVANVNDAPEGQMFVGEANKMIQLIEQGSPLQADNNLTDVDGLGEVQYQWYAQGQLIEGANTSTFIPTQAQVNQTLTVKATYTDAMGAVEVVTSTPTYPVLNVNDLPTGDVTLFGTPAQYQTLTASNTLGDTDGMGEVTYQWYADGVVIDGATSETFTLSQAQVGQVLTVQASYTDAFGAEETMTSAPTAVVANVDDAPVHVMPGEHWVLEDLRMPIGDLSVVDEDGNLASTQLSVAHGSLEVSLSDDGAVISLGANGSGSLTLQGTQAQINAALATLTYQGEANFFGTDVLQMVSSDKTGLPLVSTDSLLIEVAPDDDFAASTGDTTGLVVESNAPESVSGQLTLSDIDSVNPLFTAQTYEGDLGWMTVDESGAWTFTAREAFDTAGEGEIYSETFELAAQDGSNHAVEITFQGTNDPALIGGKLSGSLTESETGTTLFGILENIDPDSAAGFAVQNKAGSYGHFKLDIGQSVNYVASWTYDLDAALESLNLGQQVTDRFTIVADDGTESEVVITIHGENDAPVLASSTAVTYAENAAPLPIHTLITVSDVDNATMASATVEISGGYVAGQDVLSFTNVSAATMGNIAGTYANGTMTLSSAGATASKAQWQAALRAVAYSNTSDAPTTTERTIRYEIDDGAQSASPVTSTITVTASNDAAVITGAQTASLTETDAAQSTGGTLTVSDVDTGEAVFQAPASLTGAYGTFTFNENTGVWGYTLDSTKPAVQALPEGTQVTDTLTVVSKDGTATQDIVVTITGKNDTAAISGTATGVATEDSATAAGGTVTVSDVDTGEAVFQAPASLTGAYGTFTFNEATGVWGYTLDSTKPAVQALPEGTQVTDTLTVVSKDGTATQDIVVTITGKNDTATISGTATGVATEDSDTAASGTLSVSDVDTGEAMFQAPASLAGTYGNFTFDETTGVWGYTLDSSKASVQALPSGTQVTDTLAVTSKDGTATENIVVTIRGTNDAAAITGTATGDVTEDSATEASGILTVTDVDTDEAVFQAPASLAGTYGTFTFDEITGVWGYALDSNKASVQALPEGTKVTDTLTVLSKDGTASQSIVVTITGKNDAAAISGTATGVATEDSAAAAGGTLSVTDVDTDEAVFQVLTSLTGNYGTFTFNATTGVWSYALDSTKASVQALPAGTQVTDTLTVMSKDGTDTQDIVVTITGTNDTATITGTATGVATEDSATAAGGTLSVTDVDTGEAVFQVPASLAGTYGTFTFNATTGVWDYALDSTKASVQALPAGTQVTDTLTVLSKDGTDTQDIVVTITGTNDTAAITGTATGVATEDSATAAGGTLSVTDVDTGEAVFQVPASLTGTYGTFTFDATTGVWGYALDSNKASVQALPEGTQVTDTLTVKSKDGTATQDIVVTITGKNDAAAISGTATGVATEDSATEASGTLTVTDVDTGEAVFQVPASLTGTYGTFTFDATTGVWSYALDSTKASVQALPAGTQVTDKLTVLSKDGTATQDIVVTITGTNDTAAITGTATGVATEDSATAAGGTLSVTDVDTDEAVFQAPAELAGIYGTFTFNETTGVWGYALDSTKASVQALPAGTQVTDKLTVLSKDGTATQDIVVTITGTNDAPALSVTSAVEYTSGDAPKVINAELTLADVDNATMASATVKITGGYAAGQDELSFSNDGSTMGNIAATLAGDTLTLTSVGGTATQAQWQAALRAVAYRNVSATPDSHERTISYVINDGLDASAPLTSTVQVQAGPSQTVSFSSMTKDSGVAGSNADWLTHDGSAGRLVSGTLSAPLEADQTLKVYANGEEVGNAVVSGTNWQITDTAGYSANWTYTAKVMDAQSLSGPVASQVVTTDFVEAAPVITAVTDVATATIANNGTTLKSLSTVSGSGVTGNMVYLYDNTANNLVGTATVVNGMWNIPLGGQGDVAAGSNVFSAVQMDPSGNTSVQSNLWTVNAGGVNLVPNGNFSANTNFTSSLSLLNGAVNPFTGIGPAGYYLYPVPGAPAGSTTQPLATSTTYSGTASNGSDLSWSTKSLTILRDANLSMQDSNNYAATKASVMGTDTAMVVSVRGDANLGKITVYQVPVNSIQVEAGRTYQFSFNYEVNPWFTKTLTAVVEGVEMKVAGYEGPLNYFTTGTMQATYTATETKYIDIQFLVNNNGATGGVGGELWLDDISFQVNTTVANGSLAENAVLFGTSGGASALSYSGGLLNAQGGDDVITVAATDLSSQLLAGGVIQGGDGYDTLVLAAGTTLDLADLRHTQTVKYIDQIEALSLTGNANLTLNANDVLSLGGEVVGGKVRLVINKTATDVVTLENLVINPGHEGAWVSSGTTTLNGYAYNVLNHSTTQAQVLMQIDNAAPVLSTGSTLAYTENDAATAINTAITVADVDNTTLTSATVKISGGYVAGQDVLSFTNVGASMGNIAGSLSDDTMTLTSAGGSATLAQWQAALRAVAYRNTSDAPDVSARTVSYVVSDGQASAVPVTSTIDLTPSNDLPTGNVTITGTLAQGATLTANNTLADLDGLGTITYTWYANGTAIPAAVGSTYVLTANDVDKAITVKAGYTDLGGTHELVTSASVSYQSYGQAVVDLGDGNGQLIAPMQVEGKWYYYWDRSGDGNAVGADDAVSHNTLDTIFKYDINGNLNPQALGGTSNVYRFATINGVQVALPTVNGGLTFASNTIQSATAVVGASTTNNNPRYDEMLAVWDASNGSTVTTASISGVPSGWMSVGYGYWTATETVPNLTGHYYVMMNTGGKVMLDQGDANQLMAALEVVQANSAPVLNAAASPVLSSVQVAALPPTNGDTTAGNLVSELVGLNGSGLANVTDSDAGAVTGMAITGVQSGTVWFSTNGGTTWQSAVGLSDAKALRLAPNDRVFYQPDGTGAVGDTLADAITFRAWDQSYGASGTYENTAANGGKAQFSSATDTVAVSFTSPELVGTTLDLGVVNGMHLRLIGKTDANGKTYYHVDKNMSGTADAADYQGTTHDVLDTLFNGGADTTGLSNPVAGEDTERSLIINGYTVILPTITELQALRTAMGGVKPTGWDAYYYWSSTSLTPNAHRYMQFSNGTSTHGGDTSTANFAVQVLRNPVGPVVLDLNGDGTLAYSQVAMDVNGDGRLDHTAWAGAQDGVLVWDKNGNGVISDASQYAFTQYGGQTDLQGLAAGFDSNADGVFDAADAKFAEFAVWQDANQNGVSEAGEVRSLADVGVSSIDLVSDGVQRSPAEGVSEAGRSTAQLANGGEMLVGDAEFAYSSLAYRINPEGELTYLGEQMDLDLSSLVSVHAALHSVDLSGTGANSLEISLQDVLSLGSEQPLRVLGDADDRVVLDAVQWTASGSAQAEGHSYAVYAASNGQQLWLEQHIHMA